jgi:hypothetical protein
MPSWNESGGTEQKHGSSDRTEGLQRRDKIEISRIPNNGVNKVTVTFGVLV